MRSVPVNVPQPPAPPMVQVSRVFISRNVYERGKNKTKKRKENGEKYNF
jgi:hypothetical protein